LERHEIGWHHVTSGFADALIAARPDLVSAHLTVVEAAGDEVALVLRNGQPAYLVKPFDRVLYWTDAGPWSVERYPLGPTLALSPALSARLSAKGETPWLRTHVIAPGVVGLLTVDGAAAGVLPEGTHRFWNVGRAVEVRRIDMRWRTHDVTGQEILTRDRVSLRVNLTAIYRVTDPERAVTAVADFGEALHRALQLAFRRTLGALTLDRLLAEKVAVDAEAAEAVRAEMAAVGIELGEIALRDVILPGEMRTILNAVVEAEKAAEAGVIRRREETNATRALLNTAKVMAENPVMLRLKELEALETIAARVDTLTIHSGTKGLMDDIVRLRD
ncbi:MAG: slipin family protein, partial [Pseudomonadota bacterium]